MRSLQPLLLLCALLVTSPVAASGTVVFRLLEKQSDGSDRTISGAVVTVLGYTQLPRKTDDDGVFCADYQGEGSSVQVSIKHPDYVDKLSEQIYLTHGCDPGVIQRSLIYMQRRGTMVPTNDRSFRAVVRDRQGRGLSDVSVNAFMPCIPRTVTSSDGYFRLRTHDCAVPDELTIELSKPGYQTKRLPMTLSSTVREAAAIQLETELGSGTDSPSVHITASADVADTRGQPATAIGLGIAALASGTASFVLWRVREGKADDFNVRPDCNKNQDSRGGAGCKELYDTGKSLERWSQITLAGASGLLVAGAIFLWVVPRADLSTQAIGCSQAGLVTSWTCRVSF